MPVNEITANVGANVNCTNITGTFNFCFSPRNNGVVPTMNRDSFNEIISWVGIGIAAGIVVLLLAVLAYETHQRHKTRNRSAAINEGHLQASAELSSVITSVSPMKNARF